MRGHLVRTRNRNGCHHERKKVRDVGLDELVVELEEKHDNKRALRHNLERSITPVELS